MSISPEKPLLSDTGTATIVAPDGTVANYPSITLSHEDAKLLREYKKFLQRNHLQEALYCLSCYERNLAHGCEAFVTTERIVIKCRCRIRAYAGATL